MVRALVRGVLVTVVGFCVVASAVGPAAASLALLLPGASISADLGAVRLVIGI
jgi:hypothetical protein